MLKFIQLLGTNEIILGVASASSILGLILTVVVSIRTAKISKILKYNKITDQYNKERIAYKKVFEGHFNSIVQDNIRSVEILKDILKTVEEYRSKFEEILPIREKITLYFFVRMLKKDSSSIDYNKVVNYLAKLSGRLSRMEDIKNG